MNKILVTGATGAVGRELIPVLLKQSEISILTINRQPQVASDIFGTTSRINHTDISEKEIIQLFNPNIVIHLASYVTSACDLENGKKLVDSNIVFGIELFETIKICTDLSLFLNFGTFAEFRMGTEKFDNAYLYSASKTAFRTFAEFYSKLIPHTLIHIVPYTIYGTNDSKKKILDYVYDAFFSEQPVSMSPGKQILDFIHVNDVVDIITKLIMHENIHEYHTQNIFLGTGKGTSIRELVEIMKMELGREPNINWGGIPYRDMDVMYGVANISKLVALDCMPKIDIQTGIKEFLANKKR